MYQHYKETVSGLQHTHIIDNTCRTVVKDCHTYESYYRSLLVQILFFIIINFFNQSTVGQSTLNDKGKLIKIS